jgi:hypothetical protein
MSQLELSAACIVASVRYLRLRHSRHSCRWSTRWAWPSSPKSADRAKDLFSASADAGVKACALRVRRALKSRSVR